MPRCEGCPQREPESFMLKLKGGKAISYMGLDRIKFEEMMAEECGNAFVASISSVKYQMERVSEEGYGEKGRNNDPVLQVSEQARETVRHVGPTGWWS